MQERRFAYAALAVQHEDPRGGFVQHLGESFNVVIAAGKQRPILPLVVGQ